MNITNTKEITLTPDEVRKIITDYLISSGNIKNSDEVNLHFNIKMESDPDDWAGRFPLSPNFKGVTIITKIK